MKTASATILALTLAATLSGCASIVGENQYPVTVNSSPANVAFEIRNREGNPVYSGTTPDTVTLKSSSGYFKGEQYAIHFTKSGHADKTETLESQVSGWYWGNILLGGLVGMLIVDPATGAMYKLPPSVATELQPQGTEQSLMIMLVDELNVTQREHLVELR
jgi:hypothetical protein